jgi:hypothetical protein
MDDSIALACGTFEPIAVQHDDPAVVVFDKTFAFELPREFRHSRAANAEHLREELMRKRERVGPDAILRLE